MNELICFSVFNMAAFRLSFYSNFEQSINIDFKWRALLVKHA